MALLKRRRALPDGPGTIGPARLLRDSSSMAVVRSGDVVILQRDGIDTELAQELVKREVAAVINVGQSVTDTYPSRGAGVLIGADVHLVDEVGVGIWNAVINGELVRVDGGVVHLADESEWTGLTMTSERLEQRSSAAAAGMSNQMDAVVANATDMLRRERAMFVDSEKVPKLQTKFRRRPVVIVTDGPDAMSELIGLRRFVVDHAPVLVGVGGGAEILLKRGYAIDLLVGAGEDLTTAAIEKADEIVLVSASGALDRPERFEKHGRHPIVFTASGDSSDLSLLLVDAHEPDLIVLVGASTSLGEMIELDPVTAAGGFLTRLRASQRLVDANAVRYFTRQRIGLLAPTLLLLVGVIALLVSLATTPVGREWLDPLIRMLSSVFPPLGRLFP